MTAAYRFLRGRACTWLASLVGLGFCVTAVHAQRIPGQHPGSAYEILRVQEASEKGSNGSTSSSTDRDTLVERLIEERSDGVVLEYDLPASATGDDRARSWQFPARVLLLDQGESRLLNAPDLEQRLGTWLKKGQIPRSACGHWIFTWNAFKIECDPNSVLETVAAFNLRVNVRDGAAYQNPRAATPAALRQTASGPQGTSFTAEMTLDPEKVRRSQAESDVVVAEIMKKPLTLDEALRTRSADVISGTMTITFTVNSAGVIQRRVTLTRLKTTRASGVVEERTVTETLERKPL